jgi:AraC-like DNA-binding protein
MLNRKRIQEKFSRNLTLAPSAVPVTSIDERFLKRTMEVVEKFMSDSTFGVEPFAREMGVSHTQLYRKLQAITGFSPNEFIRHMRLLRAADLMRQKAGNVAEIADMVGFNNLSYFSKVFKEKFGITPIEFLKKPIEIEN